MGSSGVLIEKKLREKIVQDDDIFEELAKPTLPKQEIPTDVIIPNPKPEMEIKVEHSKSQIPTYEFPEQIIPLGNTPKHYDQWRYMSTLLDMEPKMPSATDKLVNQYMQNNQKHIQNTKTVDEITGKDIGSAEIIKIPTLDAVRDYGVEFGLNLASLYQTAKGKLYNEAEITTQSKIEKIYDSTPHEQSLEAVLFDSAIQQSKNTPAIINPTSGTNSVIPKKQSTSIPTSSSYIKEKTQTWQGAEYLAATIGVSVLGAFVPFGRGKSVVQAAKPVLKTTPSSPNTLAYLLKATPPSADNVVQAAKKQSKLTTITLEDGSKVKLTNHNKVKPTAKIQETPMLDKLLGKPSRYVDTSVKINNKKLVDKSSQIKDTISDTISDSILNPVSKRTTRPLGKFVRKSKVSKKLNEHKLEQMLKDLVPEKTSKQSPSKTYDVTDSMKAPEINQDVFNDIVKNNQKKIDATKPKLTKSQKAESGWEYNKANDDAPDISKQSTKSSSLAEQVLETKPPKVKPSSKSPSKTKFSKKKQGDVTIIEQVLHPNRPKMTQTPMLDALLGQKTAQHHTIKHDVTPKIQTTDAILENLLKQNPKLDDLLSGKSKKKQKLILYDLLVKSGKQGTKSQQDYGFVFVHPPKLTTRQTPRTPQRTRTITKRLPATVKIPEIGLKKNNQTQKRKRKGAAKYSIWNVDVDRIGTLPGDELVTSKSTKIFKDLDKRQKAHSKSTGKSITRKTAKKPSYPKRKPSPKKSKRKAKR